MRKASWLVALGLLLAAACLPTALNQTPTPGASATPANPTAVSINPPTAPRITPTSGESRATATGTRAPATGTRAASAASPTATTPAVSPTRAPSTATVAPVGPEVERGNPNRKAIALTFDGGAGATYTQPILDALRNAGVHGTMFLTGKWAQANPELVRQMIRDGHQFANHTYSHPDLTKLSDAEVRDQIERAETILQGQLGHGTKPYFRYPYGARDARTNAIVASLGYRSIYWSLDSGDWRDGAQGGVVQRVVLSQVKNGDIVVMHLDSRATAQVLPDILQELKGQGYALVTLAELLGGG